MHLTLGPDCSRRTTRSRMTVVGGRRNSWQNSWLLSVLRDVIRRDPFAKVRRNCRVRRWVLQCVAFDLLNQRHSMVRINSSGWMRCNFFSFLFLFWCVRWDCTFLYLEGVNMSICRNRITVLFSLEDLLSTEFDLLYAKCREPRK